MKKYHLYKLTYNTTVSIEQTIESYITYYNRIRILPKLNN
ncbi:IS3 family transposase [Priestia megaterium]